MGAKEILLGIFGTWTTPQALAIEDLRLGILSWVLKGAILAYVLLMMFKNDGYLYSEVPTGDPTFWFDSGQLYETQNSTLTICKNANFNYYTSLHDDNDYWNDLQHDCYNAGYGDIVRKHSSRSGFVATSMKRLHAKTVPCLSNPDVCATLSGSDGRRTFFRKVGNACSCSKQKDYFLAGAEKMKLFLRHTFGTSRMYDVVNGHTVEGSSIYTKADDTRRIVKTCLKRSESDKKCVREFKPGETIEYTVEEWLAFAGVSLDERLTSRVDPDVRTGLYPTRRITGLTLKIQLKYEGYVGNKEFDCEIIVSAIDGWNSIGSVVTYQSLASQESMEFYDDYKKGISIEFESTGVVTRMDAQKTMNTLIAGLVLLAVGDKVVAIVAFFLLPEKKVYKNAQKQKLEYGKAMAKFGISVALACQAFKQWDKSASEEEEPRLTKDELAHVFKGPFKQDTANMFASVVCSEVSNESVTCAELVELMGDGLVSLQRLKEHAEEEHADLAKVVPA